MVMTLECPAPASPQPEGASLLDIFLTLDTPPGYRAELIDQEIIVSPPPDGKHEEGISYISGLLAVSDPLRWTRAATKGLVTPRDRVIPDLVVAPFGTFNDAGPWAPCDDVELVCEVTSSRPEKDRHDKRLGYAQANIPLYLLIDRDEQAAVLYSHSDGRDYRSATSVAFGEKLTLPEPFGVTIDTGLLRK